MCLNVLLLKNENVQCAQFAMINTDILETIKLFLNFSRFSTIDNLMVMQTKNS